MNTEIDKMFTERSDTDTAYCYGLLRSIFRHLEIDAKYCASADLRTKVQLACEKAKQIDDDWVKRGAERKAKLDAEIKQSLSELGA